MMLQQSFKDCLHIVEQESCKFSLFVSLSMHAESFLLDDVLTEPAAAMLRRTMASFDQWTCGSTYCWENGLRCALLRIPVSHCLAGELLIRVKYKFLAANQSVHMEQIRDARLFQAKPLYSFVRGAYPVFWWCALCRGQRSSHRSSLGHLPHNSRASSSPRPVWTSPPPTSSSTGRAPAPC